MARRKAVASGTARQPPARRGIVRRIGLRARWVFLGLVTLPLLAGLALYALRPTAESGMTAVPDGPRPLATLSTADYHAVAFHPTDPGVVFFGHHGGVMRSTDGGRTWQPLVARANFDGMGLVVDQSNPQTVYLAGHDILQNSNDGGASWRPLAHNLPGTDIHGFAVSPDDPARLYAFVVGHGTFRSTDRGATWDKVGNFTNLGTIAAAGGSPETLYAAGGRGGVLRSGDGAKEWVEAGTGLVGAALSVAVDRNAPQTVYAGTDAGLFKSIDGGKSWHALPFPGKNVVAIGVSSARPGRVLAVSLNGREGLVYGSDDGGESWRSD